MARLETTEAAALSPPGDGRLFLALPSAIDGRTAAIGDVGTDGLPIVVRVEDPDAAPPHSGVDLVLLDDEAVRRFEAAGGERAVRKAVARLRRNVAPAVVAAPASPEGPFDQRKADVVLVRLDSAGADAARLALAAGVRAGGRPVLLDVSSSAVDPDQVVAAVDVGAAGVVIDTGDPDADQALAHGVLDREARRFENAPLISVVVCSYNGAEDLERCLRSLERIDYPRYEVVVVDDGSKDDSLDVARRHDVTIVARRGGGLSRARNAGLEAASGEIVAFIDQDAEAMPWWLGQLWRVMDRLGADGATGPNLPFPDAPWQERVVSGAPGAAMPVANPDGTCTHMAGCNMAFRRDRALAIGGFEAAITAAGDDLNFGLRMLDAGATLVLHPQAVVHHHRRPIKGFLRQQRSYVRSEVAPAASADGTAAQPRERDAGPDDLFVRPRRSIIERLNPVRPRYVFVGPQAAQRFGVSDQPLNTSLPGVGVLALLGLAFAGALPARLAGRLWLWVQASAAALALSIAIVAARVPVHHPASGAHGLAQRLATAALWLAYPAFRWLYRRRALRDATTPPATAGRSSRPFRRASPHPP